MAIHPNVYRGSCVVHGHRLEGRGRGRIEPRWSVHQGERLGQATAS